MADGGRRQKNRSSKMLPRDEAQDERSKPATSDKHGASDTPRNSPAEQRKKTDTERAEAGEGQMALGVVWSGQ